MIVRHSRFIFVRPRSLASNNFQRQNSARHTLPCAAPAFVIEEYGPSLGCNRLGKFDTYSSARLDVCLSLSSLDRVGASVKEAFRPFQYPLSAPLRLHAFKRFDLPNSSHAVTALDDGKFQNAETSFWDLNSTPALRFLLL